jgi:tight adherence protein B
MQTSLILLVMVAAVGLLALYGSRVSRLRNSSAQRISLHAYHGGQALAASQIPPSRVRTYPREYPWVPPAAGLLFALPVWWLTNLPIAYSIGGAILVAAITYLLAMHWTDKQTEQMESQLADAIDLMVASLRAGSALLASLEATLREARQPLRGELEAVVGRIRVGEDPRLVVKELSMRVPLESFRLFGHSLLVHWEMGGSLASSLRTVGRTVRDRLEVSRRISAQAIESQVSVAAVMAITYGLMVFMLDANPGPMRTLLYSEFGAVVGGGLMILQAIGMVWIWRMSRIRF